MELPPQAIRTESLEQRLQHLWDALKWLETLGVRFSASRYQSYEKLLARYVSGDESARRSIYREDKAKFHNAMLEVDELWKIHSVLKTENPEHLRKHLTTIVKGPIFYSDERADTSSNRARNVAFELSLIADNVRAGLQILYEMKADAAVAFGQHTLLFECKRPTSSASLASNVNEAVRQLDRCIQQSGKVRCLGIVAIDVSKILNPTFAIPVFETRSNIPLNLIRYLNEFHRHYAPLWRQIRSSRVVGIALRYRLVVQIREGNIHDSYCCNQYIVGSLPMATARQEMLLREFGAKRAAG